MTKPYESSGRTAQKARTRQALLTAHYNFTWEPQLRTSLRLSLEPATDQPVLRQGRAIDWITEALTPLSDTHPHLDHRKLAIAIRSATGIETLIWLIDIAGYTRDQAANTVKATAHALLDAAIHSTPRPTGTRARPPKGRP